MTNCDYCGLKLNEKLMLESYIVITWVQPYDNIVVCAKCYSKMHVAASNKYKTDY